MVDGRDGFAAVGDPWFGSRVYRSADLGNTWNEPQAGPTFPAETGITLDKVWHVEPGRPEEPGVVYAGVAPAALFKSTDNGDTWEFNDSLNNHPTRPEWQPGGGGLCLHSIVPWPGDPQRLTLGLSAVGIWHTEDGGECPEWACADCGTAVSTAAPVTVVAVPERRAA